VSLSNQQERIRAWAAANGHDLAGMYVEARSGGRADNRPEVERAMAAAAAPLAAAHLRPVEPLSPAEPRPHRARGPKKMQAVLARKYAIEQPPSCSTITEILPCHGPSVRRRRSWISSALVKPDYVSVQPAERRSSRAT